MTHKMGSPFENLRSLTKQILQFLSQTKKCNVDQLLLPKEILATLEIFLKFFFFSYQWELEAIKIATEYARNNLSPSNDSLHIFSDCQSAILAVTS